ncbi:MAG: hypothetical protein ACYCX7_03880, partial [Solirubrobacteraceae bacterium]
MRRATPGVVGGDRSVRRAALSRRRQRRLTRRPRNIGAPRGFQPPRTNVQWRPHSPAGGKVGADEAIGERVKQTSETIIT